jgi:hypothetical protein
MALGGGISSTVYPRLGVVNLVEKSGVLRCDLRSASGLFPSSRTLGPSRGREVGPEELPKPNFGLATAHFSAQALRHNRPAVSRGMRHLVTHYARVGLSTVS